MTPKLAQTKHFEGKPKIMNTSLFSVFDASRWYLEYKNWFQKSLESFLKDVQFFKFSLV